MRYSAAVVLAALVAEISAHGVITEIQGANGVNMPGLSVADGTPRDSPLPSSGAEADTSIIRENELGTSKASAVGRTNGGGAVDVAKAVGTFMGASGAAAGTAATKAAATKRGLLDGLLGGGKKAGAAGGATKAAGGGAGGLLGGLLGGGGAQANAATGTKTPKGTSEDAVAKAAGSGASSGLPTAAEDGTVTMTFHQVNQDGAGPLTASVDSTSGGQDPAAFKPATVTQDVPGIGIGGLSGATTEDFTVKAQMPSGTTCSGTVAGVSNVCVMKLQNKAAAGPFGGSVAFTQSAAAKKRAIEYNLSKRHFARGILPKPAAE